MDDAQVKRILENPKFQEMVTKQRKLSWSLTALMLFVYVGFTLLVAYDKELLKQTFSADGVVTYGVPMAAGVIVLSFVLCWIYAAISNSSFERLNREAIEEVSSIANKH
ncbi:MULTISPECIES: DUF485 domain-containing protein [unclassified Acinetobacter]|uniref:DUF485 domain-containing protein n=1 Tax=unclassified Acinetobacter TaxID=196816 RepID=UPI0035BAC627